MTTTEALEVRYEELFNREQEALAAAARNEATGRPLNAKRFRNQARGIKSARKVIAKSLGWA